MSQESSSSSNDIEAVITAGVAVGVGVILAKVAQNFINRPGFASSKKSNDEPSRTEKSKHGEKQTAPAVPTTATTTGGTTIYPAVSHYPISNPAGHDVNITYASSGKHVISRRIDVAGVSQPNLEATVYLAWPTTCEGGGHPELAIKFWGPNHTGHSCCYCYTVAVPKGSQLQLGFGGEGPHPTTQTLQKVALSIPFQPGKKYGIKGMIWKTALGVHQETWYDDGSGWKKAGTYDRPSCGYKKTSTAPASDAEVEFRIDCSNVTFSETDIAVITPPTGFAYAEPYDYIEEIIEDEHLP